MKSGVCARAAVLFLCSPACGRATETQVASLVDTVTDILNELNAVAQAMPDVGFRCVVGCTLTAALSCLCSK